MATSNMVILQGLLPYMGFMGMYYPRDYGLFAVLVINKVSISNAGMVFPLSREIGVVFSSLLKRPSTKALHKCI